uniref:CAZy families GT41 protein n=1 Tax=uncultured Enterobacter sp. TaxID=238202 RepID=A0A060CH51_9ENTR|nr:CAZy families GT41 protein [uncultured Enterobacter sp.]
MAIGCVSLDEIIQAQGNQFDFIIIHGIYSLLPGDTRQALLAWCKSQLSENGIIAFEWMTLPGSSHEKTLQDAILLHTAEAADDAQYVDSIRGVFSFLSTTATSSELKNISFRKRHAQMKSYY